MPEVQCSFNNNQENCIDTSKLMVFDPGKEYGGYFSTICKQRVYFTQLLPGEVEGECTKDNYPYCDTYVFYDPIGNFSEKIPISTPVSLYFPTTNEYHLGKLTVEILL